MRDRVERFVVLPFAIGCASESSVALGKSSTNQVKRPTGDEETKPTRRRGKYQERSVSQVKKKSCFISNFLTLPKPIISGGIHRLIRSIKSLSQIFVFLERLVYKEEIEEIEREIEIGYPTDVKHVTHIGLDGSRTTNPVKGWENLNPPEVFSFPSIPIKQFELAMAAQSQDQQPHDHVDPNNVSKENSKA
ncbi:hypothetical protein TIFTF001_039593 [Ficus carica]|uniref:CRIB domain-containing protein n=1 Tax=Ficus carica TaxID=3494 RepID=A0AA88JE16_FICCA|nr:hypothetical protein TIFTF001_039593 [Ficus carica]